MQAMSKLWLGVFTGGRGSRKRTGEEIVSTVAGSGVEEGRPIDLIESDETRIDTRSAVGCEVGVRRPAVDRTLGMRLSKSGSKRRSRPDRLSRQVTPEEVQMCDWACKS
jgi:hypothetical protein